MSEDPRSEGFQQGPGSAGEGGGEDDERGRTGGGAFRQSVGFLSALKDAIEESLKEARDRGDLSTERAREAVRGAMDRAQRAAEGARERLDFATQSEFDALVDRVAALEARIADLEKQNGSTSSS